MPLPTAAKLGLALGALWAIRRARKTPAVKVTSNSGDRDAAGAERGPQKTAAEVGAEWRARFLEQADDIFAHRPHL